jgi:hypothetical protein
MASYYVDDNAQSNGDHEVHVQGCYWLSLMTNKTYLGEFNSCGPAVAKAKSYHRQTNGCKTCCSTCHTT